MKIQQSFYISAAASLLTSLPYYSAFQPSSIRSIGYRGGGGTRDYRDYQHQKRRFTSSSSSLLQLGSTTPTSTSFESIEEKKKADTTTTTTNYKKEVQQQSSSSNSNNEHVAEGEVLSISFSKSSGSGSEGRSKFAVVKLCQEDLLTQLELPSTLSSSGLVGDSVPLVGSGSGEGEEEEKVELANALFGGGQDQRRAVNMKKTKKKEGSLGTFFLCNYLIVSIYSVYVVVVVVFLLLFFFLIHITKMHLFFSTSYNYSY